MNGIKDDVNFILQVFKKNVFGKIFRILEVELSNLEYLSIN
jgi:hypothetical protein